MARVVGSWLLLIMQWAMEGPVRRVIDVSASNGEMLGVFGVCESGGCMHVGLSR